MSGMRTELTRGVIVAGLLIGAAAALRLLSPGQVSPALASRLIGAMMGLVVIFYANAVPKTLMPLLQMRCDPAAEQALRRRTGWALVLGGAGYAVAWLAAPFAYASLLAAGLLGAAVLFVIVSLTRRRMNRSSGAT